jgi:hypothetical protein
MTSKDYFGVSLRIRHETLSPTEIANVLRRAPDYSGLKGTPRGHDRKGAPSPWREHYWCADFADGETPEARIDAVVTLLLEREAEVLSLLRSGGRADIYVFIAQDALVALELGSFALSVLGRMGVTLGLEIMRSS